jgi:hypothetical protein
MRHIFLLLILWATIKANAQMSANTSLVPAKKAIVRVGISAMIQSRNWERERIARPTNATAWLNNYIWTERDNGLSFFEKEDRLAAIALEAKKFIPQTAEYWLMRYLQSGKKDSAAVNTALFYASDKTLVYPYLVQSAIIHENGPVIKKYAEDLEAASPLAPAFYQYHFNVLVSADSNATIYARGLNDLVPLAILQNVYHVREDIHLKFFDGQVEKHNSTYLCLSLGKEVLAKYPGSLCTGLLVKLPGAHDPLELEENFGAFQFEFLNQGGSWPEEVAQLYRNYLPGFVMLYKYFSATKDDKKEKVRALIDKIADQSGMSDEVNKLLKD